MILKGALAAGLAMLVAAAAPLGYQAPQPLAATQGQLVRARLPEPGWGLALNGQPVPADADGHFVIGIDRDASAPQLLTWTTRDGRSASWLVTISPRLWKIDRLPARLAQLSPDSEEYARLRERETAIIRAARGAVTAADWWRQPFHLPVPGRISAPFGAQRIYGEKPASYHGGVDIAAPPGAPVAAPADGIVRLAQGPFSLEGNLVLVDHGQGVYSAYLHLSRIDVTPGQAVKAGDVLGAVGMTGRATGPHLHWGLTWNGVRLDPLTALAPDARPTEAK